MIESPQVRHTRSTLTYAILLVGALVMFFPLLWTVSTSLKTPDKVTLRYIELIPDPWAFENYLEIFTNQPILRYTRNTMILVAAAVFGGWCPVHWRPGASRASPSRGGACSSACCWPR